MININKAMEEKLHIEDHENNNKTEMRDDFQTIKITSPRVNIDLGSFSQYSNVQNKDSLSTLSINSVSNISSSADSTSASPLTTKISTPKVSFDISNTLESGLINRDPNSKKLMVYGNDYDNNSPRKMGNVYTYCFRNNEPLLVLGPNCNIYIK